MTSTIHMTHDSDDKQCCCAHQICPGHFSVGQTLRTDENVVLLFADTHLKQNENIKFPSLKKSLLLWKMYMHSIQQQCIPMFLSVLVKKKSQRHRCRRGQKISLDMHGKSF